MKRAPPILKELIKNILVINKSKNQNMRIIIISIFTISMFINSNAQIVTLRVNMHYILRNDGTGNFTETSDGLGLMSDYNGYEHAEYLVNLINTLLPQNAPMKYQPFGPVDNLDPEIRFQLNGVFFHRNSTLFQTRSVSTLEYNYNENVGEAFNVYFVGDLQGDGGLSPGIGGNTDAVIAFGLITSYQNWVNDNFNDWQNRLFALCIVHSGNGLSLSMQ